MKSTVILIALAVLPGFAGAADFADLQTLRPAGISKVNPFPNPSNPDSCYLQGLENGLCKFRCRSGETFQVKPVNPDAASVYEKCGAAAYRGETKATPPDAGAILAQIQQQQAHQAIQNQMIISPELQFALGAASSLRRDLKDYGIKAKVRLMNLPGGAYGLAVDFQTREDYEQVKDMFYQDPGENPSYMDLKVTAYVEKVVVDRGAERVKACWFKTIEKDTCVYKCNDGSAHTRPITAQDSFVDLPNIACPQLVFPF